MNTNEQQAQQAQRDKLIELMAKLVDSKMEYMRRCNNSGDVFEAMALADVDEKAFRDYVEHMHDSPFGAAQLALLEMQELEVKMMNDIDTITIDIGSQHIVKICKLYGPTDACNIRVRLDMNRGEWIIEREKHTSELSAEWVQIATCPMQPTDDFIYQ